MGPICLQEQTYCTCLNLTLSPLDHAFPQWHKAQGLSHLSSSVQMFPFPRTMFVLRAVFSHLTNLSLLEGHHLFGSGSIVCRELVGCFFIQYKCPPGIVKYLEIICWYSIPQPLKELADYIFASYTFFFSCYPWIGKQEAQALGVEKQLLKNSSIPQKKLCLFFLGLTI